jgi:hypothetical protein
MTRNKEKGLLYFILSEILLTLCSSIVLAACIYGCSGPSPTEGMIPLTGAWNWKKDCKMNSQGVWTCSGQFCMANDQGQKICCDHPQQAKCDDKGCVCGAATDKDYLKVPDAKSMGLPPDNAGSNSLEEIANQDELKKRIVACLGSYRAYHYFIDGQGKISFQCCARGQSAVRAGDRYSCQGQATGDAAAPPAKTDAGAPPAKTEAGAPPAKTDAGTTPAKDGSGSTGNVTQSCKTNADCPAGEICFKLPSDNNRYAEPAQGVCRPACANIQAPCSSSPNHFHPCISYDSSTSGTMSVCAIACETTFPWENGQRKTYSCPAGMYCNRSLAGLFKLCTTQP